MKKKLCLLSLLIVVGGIGCVGRVIKESYYGATGATGRVSELELVNVDLAGYDGFVVEPFSDGMEGQGNKSFLAMVQQKVSEQIIKKTYLSSGGQQSSADFRRTYHV